VDEKSPKKEISELEDTVKGILGHISGIDTSSKEIATSQLSSLESLVIGALAELTDLEGSLLDLINPSNQAGSNYQESNLLVAVRRFQNAMKVALFDGASMRDINLFEEAFNFYNNALELISSMGDQGEIDQVKSEFAQALHKIADLGDQINDETFDPFLIKTFQGLAGIYDEFEQYSTGITYHGRAGNILIKDPNLVIQANLEYFLAIIDYLILKEVEKGQKLSTFIKIRPVKIMSDGLFSFLNEKNPESIKDIKSKAEVLGAQRQIDMKNVLSLLDAFKTAIIGPIEPSAIEAVEIPREAIPLSHERVTAIQASLSKGIQQLQAAHPNLQIPVAQIDTTAIVSEIKQAISSEISKEIKSVSDDIVSRILKSMPSGGFAATPAPRSAGHISDEGIPDIEVVEGGVPGEKISKSFLGFLIILNFFSL
jgi:hypothetical protein